MHVTGEGHDESTPSTRVGIDVGNGSTSSVVSQRGQHKGSQPLRASMSSTQVRGAARSSCSTRADVEAPRAA